MGFHVGGIFKKLKKGLGKVIKTGMKLYNSPLGQIGMSFVPGGSILGKFTSGAMGGKFGGIASKLMGGKMGQIGGKLAAFRRAHTPTRGLTQMHRQRRYMAPGWPNTMRPGGWARMSNAMPSNPFLNGRFSLTHASKLRTLHAAHPGAGVQSRRSHRKLYMGRRRRYRRAA